ncbi:hypothetical protein ACPPVO_45130 [Dactylosporangium sp. McL0621]|uniref:hypothetical protein n=1 Tax=Dactylosporangium sp. McL0621 TaxID=3415678 RepID=UPI003CE9AE4C
MLLALVAAGAVVLGAATTAHAIVVPPKCYTNAGEISCLTPPTPPTPTPTRTP